MCVCVCEEEMKMVRGGVRKKSPKLKGESRNVTQRGSTLYAPLKVVWKVGGKNIRRKKTFSPIEKVHISAKKEAPKV